MLDTKKKNQKGVCRARKGIGIWGLRICGRQHGNCLKSDTGIAWIVGKWLEKACFIGKWLMETLNHSSP